VPARDFFAPKRRPEKGRGGVKRPKRRPKTEADVSHSESIMIDRTAMSARTVQSEVVSSEAPFLEDRGLQTKVVFRPDQRKVCEESEPTHLEGRTTGTTRRPRGSRSFHSPHLPRSTRGQLRGQALLASRETYVVQILAAGQKNPQVRTPILRTVSGQERPTIK
jgi:hypothetical protein